MSSLINYSQGLIDRSLQLQFPTGNCSSKRSGRWRSPEAAVIPNLHLPMRSLEVKNRTSVDEIRKLRLITAIKTPYLPDGRFDLEAYDSLMHTQILNGAEGVIVGGTTGEGHLMSWDEHIMLIGHTVNCFGGLIKVIGNTGSNSTREAIHATEQGFAVGMHAALHINPYYGKTSVQGLVSHFESVLSMGPTIIYNVPGRTGQDIPPFSPIAPSSLLLPLLFLFSKEMAGCCSSMGISHRLQLASVSSPSLTPFRNLIPTTTSLHGSKRKLCVVGSANGRAGSEDGRIFQRGDDQKKGGTIDYSGEKPSTPILDTINYPVHMKNLSTKELEELASELRSEIVYTVSKTGGHLSSSLGVVELSVAIHHVFNSPEDKIIWDVGHQAYPHKILTGRRSRMHTIRQTSGLAGFPKRQESAHDAFGAGHSSTSISAGLGMAIGRDLQGKSNHVIAVIGDGAMTAGQAYEAMNNAGYLDSNLIVILNDNRQVSLPTATVDGPAPPVGALSKALTRLQSSRKLRLLREAAKGITKQIGGQTYEVAAKVDEYARGMISGSGSCLFEELGLYYIGPVDGHNVEDLVFILEKVKAMPTPGPVLIHIVTEKGKGYAPAEVAADKMHGVVKFDPKSGKQMKAKMPTLSFTQYFAESLIAEAEQDEKIVAIHAAMGGGTGLNLFQKRFPERCFDVGIAEQHAVTFAAGLATEGLKPFCAIYSSFLQRGYDQVVHDVDLQKLPVRFAMDRAGLVGADGPTHCGAFDTAFMACLPNMVVMAPSDETELMNMVATAVTIDDRPSCFRFPRGNGIGSLLPPNNKGTPLEIGKGRILREGSRVAILGFGSIVQNCMGAGALLQELGVSATIADARFCKPLDGELIRRLAQEHEILLTVEEGSIGGFSSHVSHFLALNGLLDGNLKWRAMMLPDRYIEHGSPKDQIEEAGLSSKHIAASVLTLVGKNIDALQLLH